MDSIITFDWIRDNFITFILLGIILFALLNICFPFVKKNRLVQVISILAACVYMAVLIFVTFGERERESGPMYQLEVFWSYKAIYYGNQELLRQDIENVFAFFPLGMFLRELFAKRLKWYSATLVGATFSIAIEVTQLLTHLGLFEFDDIIHNTLGTLLGYMMAVGIQRLAWTVRDGLQKKLHDR